jgi:hypothetical protein
MIRILAILIFWLEPKFGRWTSIYFMPASIFFVGLGVGSVATAKIRDELGPPSFVFISAAVGFLAGVFLFRLFFPARSKIP